MKTIPFSGAMFDAIRYGYKTETRRPKGLEDFADPGWQIVDDLFMHPDLNYAREIPACPYGEVGDQVCLQEAPADDCAPQWPAISAQIAKIRVERVRDITEVGAMKEGVHPLPTRIITGVLQMPGLPTVVKPDTWDTSNQYREAFVRVWADIYGIVSWRLDVWVWVIEFSTAGAA